MDERRVQAIRGATTVEQDTPELIRAATRRLLLELTAANAIGPDDIISAIFTVTSDLSSEFPARAARELGWVSVPLLCTVAPPIPNAPPRCIRVLLHVDFPGPPAHLTHVALGGATHF